MNNALFEARKAPAVLEQREKGKRVLVRTEMIKYIEGICAGIDNALAEIPQLLKKHGLAEYDNERLQRAILQDGVPAVEEAVLNRVSAAMEKGGIIAPKLRRKLALESVEELCTPALKQDLEALLREIEGFNKDLDTPVNLETLWFRSGKLRIQPKYLEGIAPRYTLPVEEKELKTVEKIREAAALIADLKAKGVQVSDAMRVPPAGGNPILAEGLITRMAKGTGYTDAELLGLLHGIELTH